MTEAVIMQSKSVDWFLYDNAPRHERLKNNKKGLELT